MAGKASKPVVTALKGDLDIFSIQGQAAGLKQAFDGAGPFVLDLEGVGDVDLSGIQLLVSAAVGRDKGTLRFQGVPASLEARLKDLGLSAYLAEVQ